MLNEKRVIELLKAFIENPSAKNAIKMVRPRVEAMNIIPCEEANDSGRLCENCVWEPICRYGKKVDQITDEEVSSMVLDAMKIVAIREAEHA